MNKTGQIFSAALASVAAIGLTFTATAPASANPNAINPIPVLNGTNGLPQLHGRTRAVFQATGMASPNNTHTYNVFGTDLGIMWDNGRGEMLTAFGDTAGIGFPNLLLGSTWAWRSNVLVRSHTTNPVNGVFYDSVVRDLVGQARDLVPSPKIPGVEISRIPTAGISANGTQYMSFMSVKNWGQPGSWTTNYSSLYASTDNGEHWGEAPGTRRPNDRGNRNFQMGAFLKDGGFIYQYGTPPGRNQNAYLTRVRESAIGDLRAYEYWTTKGWKRGDVDSAGPVAFGVSELSVMYNKALGQYIMLTTDPFNSVVMRRASKPEGPWSAPEVLIDTRELPTAYAPQIFPYQTGRDLYFLTTVHTQYNVVLMRASL